MTVTPSQFRLLANALSFAQTNHQVIGQNIANVNTPNYQAQEVSFDAFLEQVHSGMASREPLGDLPIQAIEGLTHRNDGNNVDLDQQVGQLKMNAMLYQTYSQLLASKMAMARRAMS